MSAVITERASEVRRKDNRPAGDDGDGDVGMGEAPHDKGEEEEENDTQQAQQLALEARERKRAVKALGNTKQAGHHSTICGCNLGMIDNFPVSDQLAF
eukprot:scaffold222367_cov35-Prasinocladus_malaysianus.AAC.1